MNRQTGAVGDPTELKENPNYRLRIAPLAGQPSWESICGDVIFTPRPEPTRGGPDPSRPGNNTPKPKPTECPGNSCDGDDGAGGDGSATASASLGVVPPLLGVSTIVSLVPLLGRAVRRRRSPPPGAWDNPERVHRRPGADPGGG